MDPRQYRDHLLAELARIEQQLADEELERLLVPAPRYLDAPPEYAADCRDLHSERGLVLAACLIVVVLALVGAALLGPTL